MAHGTSAMRSQADVCCVSCRLLTDGASERLTALPGWGAHDGKPGHTFGFGSFDQREICGEDRRHRRQIQSSPLISVSIEAAHEKRSLCLVVTV